MENINRRVSKSNRQSEKIRNDDRDSRSEIDATDKEERYEKDDFDMQNEIDGTMTVPDQKSKSRHWTIPQ